MTLSGLAIAGLRRNARSQIAVGLGAMVATAALVGALLVGDSLRGSLQSMALHRLGNLDHAIVSARSIREERAGALAAIVYGTDSNARVSRALTSNGSLAAAATQARANGVHIWGVEPDFWSTVAGAAGPALGSRTAAVNQPLADQLRVAAGDDVLLQLARAQSISPETLLGRRDEAVESIRLTITAVLPDSGAAAIALAPSAETPLNLFLPLPDLQRLTDETGRINTLLISSTTKENLQPAQSVARAQVDAMRRHLTLEDYRLRIRVDEMRGLFSLESETMLLDPAVESAAMNACARLQLFPSGVISYLANSIRLAGKPTPSVPYSIVTGIDPATPSGQAVFSSETFRPLQMGEILLNQWTADELGAAPGDAVELSYYVTGEFGKLAVESSLFRLRAIVPMSPAVVDPGYVPEFKGVTDAVHLSDWDPPFPMDLKTIRPQDEAYWDQYRTAPKGFVVLEDARRHWSEKDTRFGQLTAIRFTHSERGGLAAAAERFESSLLAALPAESLGLRIDALRETALAASAGTTDFGGLFIGFSFFLIVAAAILIGLLFRLNVERRATEVGTLRAIGWRSRRITRLFLTEGAIVCVAGAVLGLPAACGYAWMMLAGLRGWWSAAVNAPLLELHVTAQSLAVGGISSWLTGLLAIALSLRGLRRVSPRALLAGQLRAETDPVSRPAVSWGSWLPIAACLLAAVSLGVAGIVKQLGPVLAFFLSGVSALLAAALLTRTLVRVRPKQVVHRPGFASLARLAWRNAIRNPGRSTSTAVLVAMASFLILSLSAFRLQPAGTAASRSAGDGGYALFAESTTPILRDPNDWSDARDAAPASDPPAIYPLRLRPGDAGSCLNLYVRRAPRILGATEAFIDRGGFSFAAVDERFREDRENPWFLLESRQPGGEIPVIGDEAAVRWQFHKDLGETLEITDERGNRRALRFVALLSGSVLQDELIISERAFKELFPSQNGYSFFLIDPSTGPEDLEHSLKSAAGRLKDDPEPARESSAAAGGAAPARLDELSAALEKRFAEYGLDVRSTRARLADYLAVQNTYLSTFQTLGGFGLLLGGLGLAAIMLRNIWERRGELALLRSMGYQEGTLRQLVVLESAQVLAMGILAGVVPAIIAVAPLSASRPAALPASAIATVLVLLPLAAIGAGSLALRSGLRSPVADTLKRDDL